MKVPALLIMGVLASACASNQTRSPTGTNLAALSPCLKITEKTAPGVIVGLGEGTSLSQARQRAYADISEQLAVKIQSQSDASVNKQDAQVSSGYQQTLSSYSEAQLSELQLECMDQYTRPGVTFVTYSYDRRALAVRTTNRLTDSLGYAPAHIEWHGPAAVTHSPLLTRINNELGRHPGQGQLALPVELLWRGSEKRWLLQLGDLPVPLEPAELQVAVDWQQLEKGEAALAVVSVDGQLLPRHVRAENEYRLAIKHPAGGYGQLLGVYENGAVDVVRSNIRLAPDQAAIVPESGGVFEAALLDGKSTTDTWLLLVTNEPMKGRDLPALARRADASQLHELFEQLALVDGDVSVQQLIIE